MRRAFLSLVLTVLSFFVLFGLSWAQCPEDATDLGECDTLNVVPWPETDTCFIGCNASGCDTICINNPGEDFPRFLFVPIMVTHDSNTFWWDSESKWVQDSIAAFVVPLGWDRTNPAKYCSLSAYFNDAVGGNMNPYSPIFRRSMFRHFHPEALDSNRMAVLASQFMGLEWSTIVSLIESDSSWYYFGDDSVFTPPHMWLSMIPTAPSNRRWWEGDRTLLATLTFTVEDTMHICIDSMFWPPSSKLSFTRMDAKVYQARHNLPQCIWVGPPLIVTSPNGGETWSGGDVHDITWLSEGFAGNVKIEYSTNGGTDWITIIGDTDNDGTHPWTVPNTPSAECRVRVSDAADGDPSDMSDDDFTITLPNQPPVVSDIPNQTIAEGESFASINLDNYVTDPDDHDSVMTWTHWGETELLVDITDRVATISVPHPDWNGSETIWFKACDPEGLCDSNQAAFTVTAENDTPLVSDIPNQSIAEGESFASISLDDYVTDVDDHDSVMIWTHSGEVELVVDITDRVATISVPHPDWNGSETIWFRACDPGGLCDSNDAAFTVTAENDTPLVSDIPNQTIAEGESFASISLDDYVTDPDDHDSVMIWTQSGETELLVDITNRVATISVPHPDWNGSETIWFKACDPGALCDSNDAAFTVTAVNDTPLVSDIPNQTIAEGQSFASISLDDYVADVDDHDSVMIWTHSGEVELLVDITDRVATISLPNPDWNGSETIWFRACDPGGLCDSNDAAFTVTADNDPPLVSDIPNQTIAEGESFTSISLDDYVTDPDDHDSVMIWTHAGEVELLVDITDRVATISVPLPDWNGSETIWFKACDPGGLCDSNDAAFTVTAENDTPVVLDIPNQTIVQGESFASISLDDYVTDVDDHDSVMIWTHWGETELLVDIADRVATVSVPNPGWSGSETIWFKACDPGGLCDSNEATFTVLESDFTIEVTPESLTAYWGESVDYKVVLTSINGFASSCTLEVSGHPDGSSPIFDPPTIVPTDSSILTIDIPDSTSLDTLDLIITATEMDKGIVRSDTAVLIVVLRPWDFMVEAFPDTQIVLQGDQTGYEVAIVPNIGFTAPCTLLVEGLPAGATADLDSNPILPNDTTTLTISTLVTTPFGEYDLAVIGVASEKSMDTTHVLLIVEEMTDVDDEGEQLNVPDEFALFQNQPNPFNPETKISYNLPQGCEVKLAIYNIRGRKVNTVFEGHQNAGIHTLVWDGRDDQGRQLSSGVYFYRLQAGEFNQTRKMALVK